MFAAGFLPIADVHDGVETGLKLCPHPAIDIRIASLDAERLGEFSEAETGLLDRGRELAFRLEAQIRQFTLRNLGAVQHAHQGADDLFDISVQARLHSAGAVEIPIKLGNQFVCFFGLHAAFCFDPR